MRYRLCFVCRRQQDVGLCPEHPDVEPVYTNEAPAAPEPPESGGPAVDRARYAGLVEPEEVQAKESLCASCYRSPTCAIRVMPLEALVVISRCRYYEPAM